ncbi:type II toxin-antitoxin system VapC family toxin [Sulfuricella sp.]|uniref:type II toxin-antitoxin system VapC family toxin n=1 Tax=Sulfuricella sp. TaxID=2099377 RepID=UPI002C6402EA|nr:type II toxin-antitoxin system VapC family toxin [Sulfuricella sp.]HUX63325.1 type II toxin-antitoxin system VapC family toxin [Sulfuricella sp.]
MLAVDTNILVRLVTRDDPEQAGCAMRLMQGGRIFVAKTVILELEWILRRVYELPLERVLFALKGIAGLDNVILEDPLVVADALAWCELGLDFADALHLASSHDAKGFATFDEGFRKRSETIETHCRVELA